MHKDRTGTRVEPDARSEEAVALERELQTYRTHLPDLLQHVGKYVLIKGDKVIDVFSSYDDALRQGYRDFGLEPFLVKLVQASEQVQFLTRHVQPDRLH